MFVIKTECREARSSDKTIITQEGTKVWVINERDGWVEATSTHVSIWKDIPVDVKTFDTYDGAEKFIKRWKGHPWYFVPNGNYEIIEVEEKFKQVVIGYEKKVV
jgi:hypothetical protein